MSLWKKLLNALLKLFGTKIITEPHTELYKPIAINARFEIFKDRKKQWRFRLRATNGKIICQSEGYTRRNNCIKGIKAIKNYSWRAKIIQVNR